jgi:hypothetical protein
MYANCTVQTYIFMNKLVWRLFFRLVRVRLLDLASESQGLLCEDYASK